MIRGDKIVARDKPHIWFRSNVWVAFQYVRKPNGKQHVVAQNSHNPVVSFGKLDIVIKANGYTPDTWST